LRRFVRWLIVGGCVLTAAVVVTVAGVALGVGEHQRAVQAAESDAAAVASVLEASTDHDTLLAAVARTATGRDGRLGVRIDGRPTVGTTHPASERGIVVQRPVSTAEGGMINAAPSQ